MTSAATRLSRVSIATASALALALAAAPAAAGPAFLKLGDIKGEATDDKHKGEIEILSWSWGATQTSAGQAGGGMGTGRVAIDSADAEAAKKKGNVEYGWKVEEGEKAAPAPGEAEITLKGDAADAERKRPGRVKYADITLKRGVMAPPPSRGAGSLTVLVPAGMCKAGARYPTAEIRSQAAAAYTMKNVLVTSCSAASGGDRPMESLSLNFSKIEY